MAGLFAPRRKVDPLDRFRPGGASASAAELLRAKRRKRAIIVLAILALVGASWAWNPPVGSVHYFSKSSDYRVDRDSGCTNSGKGCHGTETVFTDFNDYHPDATCTTCHEYQGVGCIPCHKPSQHECTGCHDGSMDGAPDVVRLSDPYPRGHYRESTHTAMGTDMRKTVLAAEDGLAKAECKACHSRDLKDAHLYVPEVEGSEYGREIGCGECHNDERSNGLKQVLGEWKKRGCDDCHTEDSSSPMHSADVADAVESSGTMGCAFTGSGCHPVDDLHFAHADAPKDCSGSPEGDEPICHDLELESHEPTITACGGTGDAVCHALYVNDDYSHEEDRDLHSPTTLIPAGDTSYHDTPCGGCHMMDPDGTSLVDEHALPTSFESLWSGDRCRNCHNSPASAYAIGDDWSDRDTFGACYACHGNDGLSAPHEGDFEDMHTRETASEGCGSTGPGCHPTDDLSEVGPPTVSANIHSDCLRCHDWRASGGNMSYDPERSSCGQGRDCHGGTGDYVPVTSIHDGTGGRADGTDGSHHVAGAAQRDAVWVDPVAGNSTQCDTCHAMALGTEHVRPNSSLATGVGNACIRCHDASLAVAGVVKASWPGRSTSSACEDCHDGEGAGTLHGRIDAGHAGIERDATGLVVPGSCAQAGCHATTDLRRLHRFTGCTTAGCHSPAGDIRGDDITSCGGPDATLACHVGFSASNHFVDHDADLTGTVNGIPYRLGENAACFGCHFTDLVSEHSTAMVAASMDGGGATACAVCHAIDDDPGVGEYATLPAVTGAIASRDLRCSSCHASGSSLDGPMAAASAHKAFSSAATLPPGTVRSDPFDDWREALDAPAGGGHNSLPADLVGAGQDVAFPVTTYVFGGAPYVWELPPNTGTTTWLRASVFGTAAVADEVSIRSIQVTCDDCHSFGAAPTGPHGSAVTVNIDPAYSQTEYSNPTPLASQFKATGTNRVVCFKCHNLASGSVPGTTAPGGNAAHAAHVGHSRFPPYNPTYFGEKCVDCHVRVPHAWKHQRLLIRTAVTTDGVTADPQPYVRLGHDGLVGIRLRTFTATAPLEKDSCVTGGCYGPHRPWTHPMPSDVPTAALWP